MAIRGSTYGALSCIIVLGTFTFAQKASQSNTKPILCSQQNLANRKKRNAKAKQAALPCAAVRKADQTSEPDPSVGVATMTKNRTIIMDLRAKNPDGTLGEARLVYPPAHENYAQILKHLGGLEPGECKRVPPFPSDGSEKTKP